MTFLSKMASLSRFTKNVILLLGMIVVTILCVLSVPFTTKILNYSLGYDKLSVGVNTALFGILSAIALFTGLHLVCQKTKILECSYRRVIAIVTVCALIVSIAWVYFARVFPFTDDQAICEIGLSIATGDTHELAANVYYSAFPYQAVIELIVALAYRIFDARYIRAVQCFQGIMAAATITTAALLTQELFTDKRVTIVSCILLSCFLPLFFYTTFIYGLITALPFLFAAFWEQVRWIKGGKVRDGILSVILIALCLLIKSSYSPALIAMSVIWVLHALREKNPRGIILCVLSGILYLTLNKLTICAVTQITGVAPQATDQKPSIAFIAMGLMDDPNSLGPGWYNAWTWNPDFPDVDSLTTASRDRVVSRLHSMVADPHAAADFLGRKLLSEWSEPTYQSLFYSNCTEAWSPYGPNYGRDLPAAINGIYYGATADVLLNFMDGYQALIYCGALIYLLSKRFTATLEMTTPLLFVIGGFILYLFWEAKSQYVMAYVLALVPYASSGLLKLSDTLIAVRKDSPKKKTDEPFQTHTPSHLRSVKEANKTSKKHMVIAYQMLVDRSSARNLRKSLSARHPIPTILPTLIEFVPVLRASNVIGTNRILSCLYAPNTTSITLGRL